MISDSTGTLAGAVLALDRLKERLRVRTGLLRRLLYGGTVSFDQHNRFLQEVMAELAHDKPTEGVEHESASEGLG